MSTLVYVYLIHSMFVFHPVNISKTKFLGNICGNWWMYAQEQQVRYPIINLFQTEKPLGMTSQTIKDIFTVFILKSTTQNLNYSVTLS